MRTDKIQDIQRLKTPLVFLVMGIFTIAVGYRLVSDGIIHQSFGKPFFYSLTLMILLGFCWYLIMTVKLHIKLGRKKLKLTIAGIPWMKTAIKLSEIKRAEPIQLSFIDKTSGSLVHYSNQYKLYDFGANRGVYIEDKKGDEYLIMSDVLYTQFKHHH